VSPAVDVEPLRFRPVLAGILRGYASDWRVLLATGALIFAPIALLDLVIPSDFDSDDFDGAVVLLIVATIPVQVALHLIGTVLYSGVIAAGERERRSGERPSFRHVLTELPYRALILADLAVIAVTIAGLLALIVPGLVLMTWFALVAPVIELERRGVRDGFRRSRELVRPHFWRVFGLVIPLSILQSVLESGANDAIHGLLGDGHFAEWSAEVVANIVGASLFGLTAVVIYFEIVERLERARAREPEPAAIA
jgi:hypothetical protein